VSSSLGLLYELYKIAIAAIIDKTNITANINNNNAYVVYIVWPIIITSLDVDIG
jgi:hypothetical protein